MEKAMRWWWKRYADGSVGAVAMFSWMGGFDTEAEAIEAGEFELALVAGETGDVDVDGGPDGEEG